MKESALLIISPDVAVNRLVADGEEPGPAQVTRDLLGAPLPAQQFIDSSEVLGAEAPVAARAGAAPVGALLGRARPVAAVGPRAVAPDLAADRGSVAAERASDLRLGQALPSERGQHISLPGGELMPGVRLLCVYGGWSRILLSRRRRRTILHPSPPEQGKHCQRGVADRPIKRYVAEG